ncbi:10689_t:CDS:2 [Paraglomus brasilianum]|uniref:10689_t:CDS:1 n=1 Tax=Paraglomus brasilianum TaxID=144538 RepID=A0A9N9GNA1_9GLOM|nr:10689_t:CDS:2 [Paraglomus brasilianum]
MSSLETFGDDVKMSSNRRKISNPSPLGLSAFAMNTFVYSVYIYGVRGIDRDNVGVGLALFYGGVIQVLAAMWEMYYGNTFPATVFASYGGFWISFGFISLPASGILQAFEGDPQMLNNALGMFLVGWTIFTTLMVICALRTNVVLITAFIMLDLTYIMLDCYRFTGETIFNKIGGIFGVITAFIVWYLACAQLLTKETSYFILPVGDRTAVAKV